MLGSMASRKFLFILAKNEVTKLLCIKPKFSLKQHLLTELAIVTNKAEMMIRNRGKIATM